VTKAITPGSSIGIIGGGQLGRMMIHAASRMGYKSVVFCDKKESPAYHVANYSITASYEDQDALKRFAELSDVVTFEFENIPHKTVQLLEKWTLVRPNWEALHISQNRLREKDFVKALGIGTVKYKRITNLESLTSSVKEIGIPSLLKTTELGYDGKGQFVIKTFSELENIWKKFSAPEGIVEQLVPFKMELSVVAARGSTGEYKPFAPVQNIHKDGILDTTIAPAEISQSLIQRALEISQNIMDQLNYVGILAVEMFVTQEDQILVNEIAPRPHNSGHWTLDACCTNQFEQHIRAICGLPLGDPTWHTKAVMKNLIGIEVNNWKSYLAHSSVKLHLYGKDDCKPGRKMGHVTELIISSKKSPLRD
jgi:5-(carboxyamino)imidazole ribonucleotide synthase